jgi:uncharacterized protein (TIGR00251 family)
MILEKTDAGVLIRVFVQPRASKNEIVGVHNDAVKIKLTSPPVEGQANAALIEFLAEVFHIAKRNIILVRGESSRQKSVEIHGVDPQQAARLLKIDL